MAHKTNKTDLKIEKLLSHKSYKPYRLLTHGTIHKAFKEKKKLLLEKKWISARSSHRGPGRKGNRTSLPDPEEGPAAIYCLPRCKFFITCYWYQVPIGHYLRFCFLSTVKRTSTLSIDLTRTRHPTKRVAQDKPSQSSFTLPHCWLWIFRLRSVPPH